MTIRAWPRSGERVTGQIAIRHRQADFTKFYDAKVLFLILKITALSYCG